MERIDRIVMAAKATYPEYWETPDAEIPKQHKGSLALARQRALDMVNTAVTAYEQAGPQTKPAPESDPELGEDVDETGISLGDITIGLPEDAAMVQQVLTIVTYLDHEGVTAYVVRTSGDGLMTSWLGMCMLAQNYLLNLPRRDYGEDDD